MKGHITLVVAILTAVVVSPSRSFASTCAIVEGARKYNAAGDQVGRCQPLAKRTHYKIVSRGKAITRNVRESGRASAS